MSNGGDGGRITCTGWSFTSVVTVLQFDVFFLSAITVFFSRSTPKIAGCSFSSFSPSRAI